jgi:hypothetical protein
MSCVFLTCSPITLAYQVRSGEKDSSLSRIWKELQLGVGKVPLSKSYERLQPETYPSARAGFVFAVSLLIAISKKQDLTWPLVVRLVLGYRLCPLIECGGRLKVRADAPRVGPVLGVVPLLRALDPTRIIERHGLVHGHLLGCVLRLKGTLFS